MGQWGWKEWSAATIVGTISSQEAQEGILGTLTPFQHGANLELRKHFLSQGQLQKLTGLHGRTVRDSQMIVESPRRPKRIPFRYVQLNR